VNTYDKKRSKPSVGMQRYWSGKSHLQAFANSTRLVILISWEAASGRE